MFITLGNLSRFWANLRSYITDLHINANIWKTTSKGSTVSFYPIPRLPLFPTVYFSYKESLPSGTKSSSNPSTITGVSSVTVNIYGETSGNPEETATVSLKGSYFGGSLDFYTKKITVTHLSVSPESSTVDVSSHPAATSGFSYADTFGRTITVENSGNTLNVGSSGGLVVYKLATPYTVDLAMSDRIISLVQVDLHTPRKNIAVSPGNQIQVDYPTSYTFEVSGEATNSQIDSLFS